MTNIFAASSASGIGALGINGQAFLIQLITFLIVFFILQRYAFKPILRVLRARRQLIEDGVKLGEQMKEKSVELEEEVSAALHKARTDADKIMSSADQQARQIIQEAETAAKLKTKTILSEAEEQIKQETEQARRRLEKELVGLISEATEVIIDEKIDEKKDAALIDKALKGVRT